MMNKERVLIVHNYYQVPGGEDTVVANEKKMLEDNGHEVFMYTRHNYEIKRSGMWGKLKLPFETIYSLKTVREVKKIIRVNKIDIVHVHNTLPLISPSVYRSAKECGCKVVQTVHNFRLLCPGATLACNGQICEKCISKGLDYAIKNRCYRNSKIQTFIVILMLKVNRIIGSYDKVDAYISLTEFNKEKLKSVITNELKIYVKPNFVKSNNLKFRNREVKNYFVYFGRLDKIKGFNFLVETWKNIKDSELYVIGDGPEKKWAEDYIKKNNMDNVKLKGFMEREDAYNLIKNCKSVILPSQWYEGFPMTIIESFSLGVSVICGRIGNLKYIIKDNYNGLLFEYNSKKDLENCINKLKNDFELINRLSYNSFNDYIKNYSSEKNYKQLMEIYKK
ncbi:hypothetical protein CCS79_12495 [Clostridium diolis]|uniref:glycosyltransferase family 4 protein n=1 Tax=Clostridium diolis TaxID=223919 RepID=UPI000B3F7FBB|nr:glycosyltransferase family 4 protein [Clostridium diolis]OVE67769.1 hypothetical protein CCS79_12495 [Clostridium diolis]